MKNGVPDPIAPLPSLPKSQNAGAGERQIHGFKNEERVVEKYDLFHLKENYTGPWDALTKQENPIPVSIKTKKLGGAIEMGDFFRNAAKNEDFYLHVSFWQGAKSNITTEHALLIPSQEWVKLFPSGCDTEIRTLIREAKSDYSYDAIWKEKCAELKVNWASLGSVISLAPKRDHKGQKRMQCSIPNNEFFNLEKLYGVDGLPKGPNAKN